jgi:hypothetical protein
MSSQFRLGRWAVTRSEDGKVLLVFRTSHSTHVVLGGTIGATAVLAPLWTAVSTGRQFFLIVSIFGHRIRLFGARVRQLKPRDSHALLL